MIFSVVDFLSLFLVFTQTPPRGPVDLIVLELRNENARLKKLLKAADPSYADKDDEASSNSTREVSTRDVEMRYETNGKDFITRVLALIK
jgi:hypothetical protein